MPIEQLYYTWATVGLRGVGGYQPVAKSAGLDRLPANAQQLALKLCHYSTPAGSRDQPVSFGWIDGAGLRYAFLRTFLPHLQVGRPGNFAAHIVIGEAEDLPIRAILESYGSSIWWSGPTTEWDGTGAELPEFRIPAGSRRRRKGAESASDVLEQLLANRKQVRISGDAETAVGALACVAAILPSILAGRAFSTYEYGETETWFSILGNGPSGFASDHPDTAAAASYILSRETPPKWLDTVEQDPKRRAQSLVRVVSLAATLFRLQSPEPLLVDDVVRAVSHHEAIAEVLDYEQVRQAVAAALVSGHQQMWNAVAANAGYLDHQSRAAMGANIAAALGCQPPTADLMRKLSSLPEDVIASLASALLEEARRAPTLFSSWPASLVHAASRHVTGSVSPADRRLWEAFVEHGDAGWLLDQHVPSQLRCRLAARLIRAGAVGVADRLRDVPDVVANLLELDPEVFLILLDANHGQPRLDVLEMLDRAFQAKPGRLRPAHAAVLARLLYDTQPTHAVRVLLPLIKRDPGAPPEVMELADSLVDQFFRSYTQQSSIHLIPELLDLLRRVPSGRSWFPLVNAASRGSVPAVQKALAAFQPPATYTASLVAFDLILATNPVRESDMGYARALASTDTASPVVRAQRFLRVGMRHARVNANPYMLWLVLEKVLESGDFEESATKGVRAKVFRQRDPSTAQAEERLNDDAAAAVRWLRQTDPRRYASRMTGLYQRSGPSAARWLDKVGARPNANGFRRRG